VCCVGSDLCDELIAGLEKSYRVCVCVCLIVCDLETLAIDLGPIWALEPQRRDNIKIVHGINFFVFEKSSL